jgi:pantoate--beta-alanine ligase
VIICRTNTQLRAARAALGGSVGFVATMGALHAGHESLVDRAREECESVVVSIFVNPLQFGPAEDLSMYPRPFEEDAALLERRHVDVLFAPDVAELYPPGFHTSIDPGPVAAHFEGEYRAGHFSGVATVVLKLLNIIEPNRAYFGQKDAQQLAVVRHMVEDLNLPVSVVACPTVRERDGLAISSRNRYLSDTERRDAVGLFRALKFVVEALERGATDLGAVLRGAAVELGSLRADYLAVVDPAAFVPLEDVPKGADVLALGAAHCGTTRLIDNMPLHTT